MPIFRVLASRTEYYVIEAFLRVTDRDQAESAFYAELEAGAGALRWDQEYDGSETEIDRIEDVTQTHNAMPSGLDRRVCQLCGRPVQWGGIPANHSPTGETIPGPWLHVDPPLADDGVGL
ncbi:MAG TPA: hypothetical protein VFT80_07105 [Actinomycetota bacterium]|nr:hypothetical protein [Actinomycetota bacterium]